MTDNFLARYIRSEMLKREMRQTEFAQLLGVSQSTIGRMLRGEIRDPSLDFLLKLSNATEVDICSLIHLIRPDAFESTPSAKMVADRIANLPRQQRELVETFLNGIALLGSQDKRGDNT